jgi:hypothetical protein
MSEPHVIRLREPWEIDASAPDVVIWRRRFGRPTGLVPATRVWLCVRPEGDVRAVALNECALGPAQQEGVGRWDITAQLEVRNQLKVIVPDATRAEMSFEAWLEIVEGQNS